MADTKNITKLEELEQLHAQIATEKKIADMYKSLYQSAVARADMQEDRAEAAEARVKVLEAALQFYAEPMNHKEYLDSKHWLLSKVQHDGGDLAREVLEDRIGRDAGV